MHDYDGRVKVRSLVPPVRIALLLGRHKRVIRSPGAAGARAVSPQPRQAEIADLDPVLIGNHEISGLDVTVHDAGAGQRRKALSICRV